MASQTEAQVQSEISAAIAIFHELAKAANINTGTLQSQTISNYVARESTFLNSVPGDYSSVARAAMSNVRGGVSSIIGSAAVASVLRPLLQNYAKNSSGFTTGQPVEQEAGAILSRIYRNFIAAGSTVQSRNLTFATPAAGSNVGTGVINRLTADAYGYPIEACHVEAKRAECVASAETGTPPGEEIFQFRGATRAIDQIPLMNVATNTGGSSADLAITAISARSSMLANPSFEQYTGTSITAVTALTGWTTGSGTFTNVQLSEAQVYRTFLGITTPRSLVFTAAESVYQTSDINNMQFDANTPYYFQVAYNRSVGSATGTLTITLGNSTTSVVLAAQSGWNILRLTLDRRCWPHNFAATTQGATTAALMTVKIQWSGGTGTLYLDDVILAPMTRFDGHWYAVIGGATLFVADNHDSFTWTDTFAGGTNPSWDTGIIQTWLWRAFGCYLPSTTGAPTWADPAV